MTSPTSIPQNIHTLPTDSNDVNASSTHSSPAVNVHFSANPAASTPAKFHSTNPTAPKATTESEPGPGNPTSNRHPAPDLVLSTAGGHTHFPPVAAIRKKNRSLSGRPIKKKTASANVESVRRGSGFSRQEVDSLLDLLEEWLPLAKEEWDCVKLKHSERYPELSRTVDSLRRKVASLHRRKIPTGDPAIPPDVERAKQIRYKMTERADIGDGDDSEEILYAFESGAEEDATIPTDENDNLIGTETELPRREGTPISQSLTLSARPLVRRRIGKDDGAGASADIMELYKMQMLQDQSRREEEKENREKERIDEKKWRDEQREERIRLERLRDEERADLALERAEERKRREEEGKRHERLMEILLLSLTKT